MSGNCLVVNNVDCPVGVAAMKFSRSSNHTVLWLEDLVMPGDEV
jgi:hypothetical protein